MFLLSRLGWQLVNPEHLPLTLLVVTLACLAAGRRGAALVMGVATFALTLLLSVPALGRWAVAGLEHRFPLPAHVPADVDGIVVLGGAMDRTGMGSQGEPMGERVRALVTLSRRLPQARLLFSGGRGQLSANTASEAALLQRQLADAGVDPARVSLEQRSRNTDENARYSARMVPNRSAERWLLVTSAVHMPRAVGAFHQRGWNVIPWPVDHITQPWRADEEKWGLGDARLLFSIAAREALGLLVYWVTGKGDALFPAPAPLGCVS